MSDVSILRLTLPLWVQEALPDTEARFDVIEARMRLVIELARRNVDHGGGPFGAGVFEIATGRLIGAGVNLVTAANCSMLHGEIVALTMAQQYRAHYDLGASGAPACELVSSVEPCAMCLGATTWSGVARVVCGARDEDARAIGFDEGVKPPDWPQAFRQRGIEVVQDILRDQAREVLEDYQARGGEIYNGRRGQ